VNNNNYQLSSSQFDDHNSLQVTAILAVSLDGKISPDTKNPARFSTQNDL